jgi:DNA-binding MarR family transcriptional regulator
MKPAPRLPLPPAGEGRGEGSREALDDRSLSHLVGYAASRAALELRKVFQQHVGPLDLRVAEFSILMLLADNGPVAQRRLGAALDMAAPNMAATLDRMAERGWIERVRSTDDRRSQRIHLTAAGGRLAGEAKAVAATMEEPALANLSRAERALLVELLRKVAAPAAARPTRRASQEYPRAA